MKNYQSYLKLFIRMHKREPANGFEFADWCLLMDKNKQATKSKTRATKLINPGRWAMPTKRPQI